jgi:DNA-binding response OmpR family regulator/anti-anti-sigma regulatory factor
MKETRDQGTLIIADDDPSCLEVLYHVLAGAGFEVSIASDGETMLEAVRRERPDLVLLDAVMPDMDGFEACRQLKADPTLCDVPVIFMTAHDDSAFRLRTFQVGGVDFIGKPFEEAELLSRVRTHLSMRRLAKTLTEHNARLREEIAQRAQAEVVRELLMTALREAKERLERELAERVRADRELERLMRELLQRTEELREAKEQLEQELVERAQAEAERAELQEQIISAQRERLAELSTPLIPLTDGVMVMPLIGTMDAERSQQVMDVALRGVALRRASIVILDVTGVRALDASTASVLTRTSRGLELLGARAVVTGIGPDVARALIDVGAPLGSLVTKATLQDGIAYALSASRGGMGARDSRRAPARLA